MPTTSQAGFAPTPEDGCEPSCGPDDAPIGGATFVLSSNLNPAQQNHYSTALRQFQNCIAGKAIRRTYTITSISDNRIANGTHTWEQCARNGGCAHSRNSCHYGGRNCIGQSYAIDVRVHDLSTQEANAFMAAARSCGGYADRHGPVDHIHVSIGAAAGCGCN